MAEAGADAVAKARQLLHRRFKVTLVDDRIVTGDFQCLDKEGNLILGNAAETISHHARAASSDAAASSSGSTGGAPANGGGSVSSGGAGGGGLPLEKILGTVLVPKAQQKDVQLLVTLSERAAMLQLAGS